MTLRGNRSRHTSARFCPVAIPSFAESAWTSIAIRFEATITQTSVYPYFEPPAMFVAKLPGSMYATAAMNAGPRKGRRRRGPGPPWRTRSPRSRATPPRRLRVSPTKVRLA